MNASSSHKLGTNSNELDVHSYELEVKSSESDVKPTELEVKSNDSDSECNEFDVEEAETPGEEQQLTGFQKDLYREAFDLYAENIGGKRFIPAGDLHAVMKALGINVSADGVVAIIKLYDDDKDGKIVFEEFLEMMKGVVGEQLQKKTLMNAFKVFDINDDGTINLAELNLVLDNLDGTFTRAEIKDLMDEFDIDGDGGISYAEFTAMLDD